AVKECVKMRIPTETHGLRFDYRSAMLFITLPSGRRLAYVKPRIGENQFGGESVTYMGVGGTKKWERLESYGPKFVENIVQGTARDILCNAMQTLKNCSIVAHVHDEIIIEADRRMSVTAVCEQMGRTPPWAKGLKLRADGYECEFIRRIRRRCSLWASTNITARVITIQPHTRLFPILRKRKKRQSVYTGRWSIYALPTLAMWNGM